MMASKQAGIILGHIRKLAAAQRRDELPDQELLQQFTGQRDQAAFTALVQRHGPMVLRVCQRVLHNWHDAEDAFQATFLTLACKADSIRKQESVASWLHGVAYRLALQANADLRKHARLPPESPDRPTVDPADEVTWRELRAMLDEELNRLPEKYRAPLLLCYLGGLTRDEAAHQLGCPLATLKSRLERGRELLRGGLSRRGLTLSAALLATGLSKGASPAILPLPLIDSTVRAALLFTAGNVAAAGVSPSVAALTKGVLRAMLLSKVNQAGALVLTICLLGTGTGLLSYQTLATEVSMTPLAQRAPAADRQREEPRNASQVAPEETNDAGHLLLPGPSRPRRVTNRLTSGSPQMKSWPSRSAPARRRI